MNSGGGGNRGRRRLISSGPPKQRITAFDRERGGKIPASWLKSHGRSLVRFHQDNLGTRTRTNDIC
jgi:hypothetical protein